jgi:outer membrane protein insertion porin family
VTEVSSVQRLWWLLVIFVQVIVATGPIPDAPAQSPEAKVASIDIRGNKKIELAAIQGRLTLKPGDSYTPENMRGQMKILYETGYFEDVQVETESVPDGIALTFVVQEKPFITEIVFDGNEELSDDKLKEKITIKSQAFLDQQQAKESAEKIRLAYQEDGYFSAEVIPVVQTLDEDRKRLTFLIKEGEKAKIKAVNFEGMRAASKNEVFKVTATREWVPWYGLFTQLKLPSFL